MRLRTSDFEGVLGVLGEAYADDGPLPFTPDVLERLAELLRCEYATFEELDFLPRVVRSYTGCSWDPYLPDGEFTDAWWDELEVCRRPTYPSGIAKASDACDRPFRGALHDAMFETLRAPRRTDDRARHAGDGACRARLPQRRANVRRARTPRGADAEATRRVPRSQREGAAAARSAPACAPAW